jgi:hypothetical protein
LYRIYYSLIQSQFDLSTSALSGYQSLALDLQAMLGSLTVCKGVKTVDDNLPSLPNSTGPGQDSQGYNASVVGGLKSFVIALYDFDAQAEGDLSFRR